MKKFVMTLMVALITCMASVVFAAANPFNDVPADHWAYDAVTNLVSNGIISPSADGTFMGNRNTTRYEAAVMVANIYTKKTHKSLSTSANPFSDVPNGHWAAKAVTTLATNGLEEGNGDGTFLGNRNITRYEIATLIAKLLTATEVNINYMKTNPFSDVPRGHKDYDGVMIMAGTGIISGYGDGTFMGNRNINRYEMAIILDKVYKKLF